MSQTHLYMLAIMPPHELMVSIENVRKAFSEKYMFVAALKPPVHATIYEPFHASEEIEKRFSTLRNIIKRQHPFSVQLHNYNFFDHPSMTAPVVYIEVKENVALGSLQKEVMNEVNRVRKYKSKLTSYTPHFTIGYRDVTRNRFPEIKLDYSQQLFEGSFLCDAVYLWRHDGSRWQVHDTFKFEGNENNQPYGQLNIF